ncbi:MAG: TonB-dependent receptor [Flavobacteriales bacterium]
MRRTFPDTLMPMPSPHRRLSCLAVLIAFIGTATAQERQVSGTIFDQGDGTTLPGAAVVLLNASDTLQKKSTVTDLDGLFRFTGVADGDYRLRVDFVGYDRQERALPVKGDVTGLEVRLGTSNTTLKAVETVAYQARAEQKGDTTVYNAGAYKVNADASGEDLVTKMPGIVNDNGTIKAQGEAVKRVLVDGQEFFGDDASLTLKNLPAEIIDKVQVFDRLSDQSQFTGFDDGNREKILNITTKAGRNNGVFGKATAGYGTDDRYLASLSLNWFRGKERITLLGQSNNINQQNFSMQDLVGLSSSSSSSGRGGRGGPGGGGSNFLVGPSGGINTTNAIGLNYTNTFGKGTKFNGSYFFNEQNSTNATLADRTTTLNDTTAQFSHQESNKLGHNTNHRFNFRVEHAFDSLNSIILTPVLGFQHNNTNTMQASEVTNAEGPLSRSNTTTDSDRDGYTFNNDLLFRHKFATPRRTISARLGTALSGQRTTGSLLADNAFFTDSAFTQRVDQHSDGKNNTATHTLEVNYTEPVGKRGILQFGVVPSISNSHAEKLTYDVDRDSLPGTLNTRLSNRADNEVRGLRGGVSYRWNGEKTSFNVGLDGQRSDMHSEQTYPREVTVDRSFSGLLPNALFTWNKSKQTRLRAYYRSSLQAPSISKLQNVVDNSDPLKLSTGNLDLKQSVQHNITLRFNTVDSTKTRPFFALLSVQAEQDHLSNATYAPLADSTLADGTRLPAGAQLTKPVNLNGYVSSRAFVNYGFPFLPIKSNVNLNAGATYERLPGLVNNTRSLTQNKNWNVGAVISSNISKQVDFRVGYTANFNNATNDLQPTLNNSYYQGQLTGRITLTGLGGWVFDSDLNYNQYVGLGAGFNPDALVWNAAIARKFMKNDALELRVSAYDLLRRNVAIARTVSETYVESTSTTMLQRYFLVTLSFNLRAFKGVPEEKVPDMHPGGPPRGNWGPPPGGMPPPGP